MRKILGFLVCILCIPAFLFSFILTIAAIIDPGGHVALIILIPADAFFLILSICGIRLICARNCNNSPASKGDANGRVRCPECGASVSADIKKCRYCGTDIPSH